jgi:hypothetical protein
MFRSCVGMLLYLTKYSRPDLCNVVRELSKSMNGPSMGTYLELLTVIRFVLDTKNFCLKILPKINNSSWNLKVFATVIGREIPKQESALQASSFISKARPFAGVVRLKRV